MNMGAERARQRESERVKSIRIISYCIYFQVVVQRFAITEKTNT